MSALLIGALAGLAKNLLIDKPREEKQRELAAQTALYAPFTGLKPQLPEGSNPVGSAFQGAALGSLFDNALAKQPGQPPIAGLSADQELARQSALGGVDQDVQQFNQGGSAGGTGISGLNRDQLILQLQQAGLLDPNSRQG